ncbi:Glycosyl transferase [Macleaya cordata]|uniref:Hexosyltransferase n=1 Tax=Macleaya cordata TaxID=56857 RepID=A0A200Q4S9_MACCD|nr:Glycosyl transferase [Macleaya cordata]
MGSKLSTPKRKLFSIFILLFLSFSLVLLLASTFRLIRNQSTVIARQVQNVIISQEIPHRIIYSSRRRNGRFLSDFIAKEFKGKEIYIGLVNIHEGEDEANEWEELGETSLVHFKRVSRGLKWQELFPLWVDEEEKWRTPNCSEIPMPKFEDYGEFDVVIARVPCGIEGEKKGNRDLYRLQVNLVVANLVMKNGYKNGDQSMFVVFIGSCGPMWEIFRCDDLLRHEGEVWIYKPDLRRLKHNVFMLNGACQSSAPHMRLDAGEGNNGYNFSELHNPIDQPREAYVTVLHSSEDYVCGAIVLAQSIAKTNSTKDLVLLADNSISERSRRALKAVGWKIKPIERIESPHASKNAYNRWNYSKLRIWQLIEYDKVIFVDSDLIVLKNIDKFFKHPQLSAVKDSNIFFNSGIMLIEPSNCIFDTLMEKRYTLLSYNGGDQGFLNEAFTWWNRWPAKLNYFKMIHQEEKMRQDKIFESVYTIHYFGIKPWMCYRDYDCNWDTIDRRKYVSDTAHKLWWQVHDGMPKRLQKFCDLSVKNELRIKKFRELAMNASLPDEHWKIKVKDPRQHV